MSERRLPVRPDLKQLRNQAKDLLRAIRAKDEAGLAELRRFHPPPPEPDCAELADAQLALARSYQAPNWQRIVQCCRLIDAIWDDDVETVHRLVLENPNLLTENAGIRNNNWGPPMSYAANLGRDRIIETFHGLGAKDLQTAFGRAVGVHAEPARRAGIPATGGEEAVTKVDVTFSASVTFVTVYRPPRFCQARDS